MSSRSKKSNYSRKRVEKSNRLYRKIAIAVVVSIIASILVYGVVIYKRTLSLAQAGIKWDSISYEVESGDAVESLGGAVTVDSYHKVRMAASVETIKKLSDALTDDVFNNLVDGVQSDYYKDTVYSEYNQTIEELKQLVEQSEYIGDLYYDLKHMDGFTDFKGCHTDNKDGCVLKQFIDSYTGGELNDYLNETHRQWESIIEYKSKLIEADDDLVGALYQEELS